MLLVFQWDGEKKQFEEGKTKTVEGKKRHVRKYIKKKVTDETEEEKRGMVKIEKEGQTGRKENQRQVTEESNVVEVEKQKLIWQQQERWAEAPNQLYHALTEQRWDEAFALLPCILLQPPLRVPDSLLWKVRYPR